MKADSTIARELPPFQLRPNKFVDRMLFVDLIARTVGGSGSQNYVYISMGAKFLHDHHSVYRRVGIEQLISFDNDGNSVLRQTFNRPTNEMQCLEMDSADLAGELNTLRKKKNVVVWLDYMTAKDRRVQFEEAVEVLKLLEPGDLLRLTLNADYRSFGNFGKSEKGKYKDIEMMAAVKLNAQIQEFLPADLHRLSKAEFPAVLARSFEFVVDKALKHRTDVQCVPVLSTVYADGAAMVTVACAVRAVSEMKLPDSLHGWQHRARTWDDLTVISVPDLSAREKQFLDSRIKYSSERILKALPFRSTDEAVNQALKSDIENYKKFHRYYPAFHHIDH